MVLFQREISPIQRGRSSGELEHLLRAISNALDSRACNRFGDSHGTSAGTFGRPRSALRIDLPDFPPEALRRSDVYHTLVQFPR
jgi:hypothetical protein